MEAEVKYKAGDITVVWKPSLCTHSCNCWKGLPTVFKPKEKPWVKTDGAASQQIIDQIDQCPSKALSYIKEQ